MGLKKYRTFGKHSYILMDTDTKRGAGQSAKLFRRRGGLSRVVEIPLKDRRDKRESHAVYAHFKK